MASTSHARTTVATHGPPTLVRELSRAERAAATERLLRAAHDTADPDERRRLLDEAVVVNLPVAQAVSRRYRNRGVSDDDLAQAGYEGLVKAVHKFDRSVRPDLLTYAVPTIRGEIQRHFRDHSWAVRPPRRIQEMQWRISRCIESMSHELGREPSDEELVAELGCTSEELREAVAAFGSFAPISLDRPVRGVDGASVGDCLPSESDDGLGSAEARMALGPHVRRLPRRDREIIYLRYFEERSQKEIGEVLGVTQMQVSRLLTRILNDLRKQLDSAAARRPA
jgi:RNA polymerase sigma-B factor